MFKLYYNETHFSFQFEESSIYPRKQPDYRSQTSFFLAGNLSEPDWGRVAGSSGSGAREKCRQAAGSHLPTFTEKHGHKEGCSTIKKGALSKNIIGSFRFGLSLIFLSVFMFALALQCRGSRQKNVCFLNPSP